MSDFSRISKTELSHTNQADIIKRMREFGAKAAQGFDSLRNGQSIELGPLLNGSQSTQQAFRN